MAREEPVNAPLKGDQEGRYGRLNGLRPAKEGALEELERSLDLSLPAEFHETARFFDGSGFVSLPLHAIGPTSATTILSETTRLRSSIQLPANFVVLGEPPESLLVLDCTDGKVLWIDATDAPRLGKECLCRDPTIWNSFGAFFDYLLTEEEQDRIS